LVKIFFKHLILEKCIDVLFDAINNNFPKNVLKNRSFFREGSHLDCLLLWHSYKNNRFYKYFDCKIFTENERGFIFTASRQYEYYNGKGTLDVFEDYELIGIYPFEGRLFTASYADIINYQRS